MPSLTNNIFTYTLTSDTLTIVAEYGIEVVAMKLVSGTVTYRGNKKIGDKDSSAITLVDNDPVTISVGQVMDNLIIDATAGSVEIIAR